MNYEIVVYDIKIVPLKNAICKLIFTEDRTRNVIGIVCHSHDQVRNLIEQLQIYSTPPVSYGQGLDDLTRKP